MNRRPRSTGNNDDDIHESISMFKVDTTKGKKIFANFSFTLPRLSIVLVGTTILCVFVVVSFSQQVSNDKTKHIFSTMQTDECAGGFTHDIIRNQSPPSSNVKSLFNCNLSPGLCNYFYPQRFFECGPGRPFHYFLDDAEAMKNNRTLWINMPSIGFPTITLTEDLERPPNRTEPFLNETISFLHVHKAGGTTVHNVFNMLRSKYQAKLVRHPWFQPPRQMTNRQHPHAPPPPPPPIRENFSKPPPFLDSIHARRQLQELDTPQINRPNPHIPRTNGDPAESPSNNTDPRRPGLNSGPVNMVNFTRKALSHAVEYPQSFGPHDHVIIAVVRDPAERFISSIGQAMGGQGSERNNIGKILQRECIKETSKATLRCCIDYVKHHGFWMELHFTPQAIDISFSTMGMDVPVAVFPFQELGTIVKYFGFGTDTKARDGSKPSYRPHKVLTDMNIGDYDGAMLRDLCAIYEVDVVMQQSLGMEVPTCDPYIPKK